LLNLFFVYRDLPVKFKITNNITCTSLGFDLST